MVARLLRLRDAISSRADAASRDEDVAVTQTDAMRAGQRGEIALTPIATPYWIGRPFAPETPTV